jgi:hypothetical protein
MSMPEIQKRQWQLMWGIVIVFFMIFIEYQCRLYGQEELRQEIAETVEEQKFWIKAIQERNQPNNDLITNSIGKKKNKCTAH